VIAGQATVGLELLEDVDDLRRVIVPLGGGGLAAGVGIAIKRALPDVRLGGVQAQVCAPYLSALGRADPSLGISTATIADGIAIKQPGEVTLPLLRELLDDICVVDEDEIADGMVFLAERAKLVAEGAGAAVAALLAGKVASGDETTVAIVSGENVDSGLLAALLRRQETELGRRVRFFTASPTGRGLSPR